VQATIKAVALRIDLLDEIPIFNGHKKAVVAALELLIDLIMLDTVDSNVRWTLGRAEVFAEIVSAVLSRVSETGVSEDILLKIKKVIDEAGQVMATGKQFSVESLLTSLKKHKRGLKRRYLWDQRAFGRGCWDSFAFLLCLRFYLLYQAVFLISRN